MRQVIFARTGIIFVGHTGGGGVDPHEFFLFFQDDFSSAPTIFSSCTHIYFSVIAPTLWSNLPDDIKASTSLSVFKTEDKTYFLKNFCVDIIF